MYKRQVRIEYTISCLIESLYSWLIGFIESYFIIPSDILLFYCFIGSAPESEQFQNLNLFLKSAVLLDIVRRRLHFIALYTYMLIANSVFTAMVSIRAFLEVISLLSRLPSNLHSVNMFHPISFSYFCFHSHRTALNSLVISLLCLSAVNLLLIL